MKIGIFSDTHDQLESVEKALKIFIIPVQLLDMLLEKSPAKKQLLYMKQKLIREKF